MAEPTQAVLPLPAAKQWLSGQPLNRSIVTCAQVGSQTYWGYPSEAEPPIYVLYTIICVSDRKLLQDWKLGPSPRTTGYPKPEDLKFQAISDVLAEWGGKTIRTRS